MNLEEYEIELREEVLRMADSVGTFAEDAFFEIAAELVSSSGEVEGLERSLYRGPLGSGIRIDGHGGDPLASGVLDLVLLEFSPDLEAGRLTATDMNAALRRGLKFVTKSRDVAWRGGLEETSPAFALADMIAARWGRIGRIRIFLLTNRRLSDRIDSIKIEELDGKPIAFSVWDLRRMHEFIAQGGEREAVQIDMAEHGGPVQLLPANAGGGDHESYLAILPGATLASIYDRYSARLLEQNVRVFLQARGSVNKGIRETLATNPSMFFAYNNGITATAREVELDIRDGATMLTGLTDFQIVNGGQTTASITHALRAGVDLSKVAVQMKLSIVDREKAEAIVPDISRFANTQNRVNAADFFSTSALHGSIKEISERLYAPPLEGSVRQTRWFYERARGQYADAKSRRTLSERKKFEMEHPRDQVLAKTDLAKIDMTWRLRPHHVSLGAQKCFAAWTQITGEEWRKDPKQFNDGWFRDIVAKAIVWKALERLTSKADWYTNGLRANTVTYGIAKVVHDLADRKMVVDLRRVWDTQCPSDELLVVLDVAAKAAHEFLLKPLEGSNPTEWAKKQACWHAFSSARVTYGAEFDIVSMSAADAKADRCSARKEQKILTGIEAQTAVVRLGQGFWQGARDWARHRKLISAKEDGILQVAAGHRGGLVTEKQAVIAMDVLKRIEGTGFAW